MSESTSLSERELEVLRLVAEGASNNEIAAKLIISPNTVKVHMRNIYSKLGVLSRTEATMEAVRRGLIQVPGMNAQVVEPEPVDLPEPIETPELAEDDAVITLEPSVPSQVDPPLAVDAPIIEPVKPESSYTQSLAQPTHVAVPHNLIKVLVGLLVLLIAAVGLVGWLVTRKPVPAANPTNIPLVNAWKAMPPLPQALSEASGVFFADALYVIGGRSSDGVLNTLWRFDLPSGQWQSKKAKPTASATSSAVLVDQKIYVVGGRDVNGAPTTTLEIYDPTTDQWETGTPLTQPRKNAMIAALDGKIYLFGGNDGTQPTNTTFIYNPQTKTWSDGPTLPVPLSNAVLAQNNSEIIIAGGLTSNNTPQLATWRYEFAQWSQLADLPEARVGASGVFVGDVLYVIGGTEQDLPILAMQNDAWTTTDLKTGYPISDQVVVENRRTIYAIGGWNGTTALADARSWKPIVGIFIPGVQN